VIEPVREQLVVRVEH
jgi:hypothetical protein